MKVNSTKPEGKRSLEKSLDLFGFPRSTPLIGLNLQRLDRFDCFCGAFPTGMLLTPMVLVNSLAFFYCYIIDGTGAVC